MKQIAIRVAVLLIKDNKLLLVKHQKDNKKYYVLPGGHLEVGESIQSCAKREVLEETGIVVNSVRHVAFTNDIFEKGRLHYVTLFVAAGEWIGWPTVMEPKKCRRWEWFDWKDLPTPLFVSLKNLKNQGFTLPNDL